MIILSVKEIKSFMSHLFMKETLDSWLVSEVTITTHNTFQVDGRLHKDFYGETIPDELASCEYSPWSLLRPLCFGIIKGSRTPLYMKLVLQLNSSMVENILSESAAPFVPEDINGLFINIRYEDGSLSITTGSSLRAFSMDKTLDEAFENYVRRLFFQFCE